MIDLERGVSLYYKMLFCRVSAGARIFILSFFFVEARFQSKRRTTAFASLSSLCSLTSPAV